MNWERIKEIICILLFIRCPIHLSDSDEDLPNQNKP